MENCEAQSIVKKHKGGWNAAIFIIAVEVAERFSYFGVFTNLITYLTTVLHQPIATAAKNVNIVMGAAYILPILGGFVADSYLGRFKTVIISSIIYIMGTGLLTLSVSSVIPAGHREIVLFFALYIIAIGQGGHKPSVLTFAADQFDEVLPEEKRAKSSFFNWWYMGTVFGIILAVVVVVYVQDRVGWTTSYVMVMVAMVLATGIFLIGIPTYRLKSPIGSPLAQVAQVFVAAVRKWRLNASASDMNVCSDDGICKTGDKTLARTNQCRFLDKAAMMDDIDKSSDTRNYWRLCSVNQVEETKLIVRLFPIWLNCIIFGVVIAQQATFYTKQGSTMNTKIGSHFKVPPASLNALAALTIIILVFIYDRVFIPIASRITKHPSGITMLQRIGFGLILSSLTMAVAAIVEAKRLRVARENGFEKNPKAVLPMSIFWLAPQYVLNGFSDVFAVVGMQELFYDQVPEKMRSMGAAAFLSSWGFGSFLSSAIIATVQAISSKFGNKWLTNNINMAHLDYFYWILAFITALNFFVFVCFAKGFVYKKVQIEIKNCEEKQVEA